MKRLQILAAAVALGEFRVEELRAFAGANLETVRSVLRRDAQLFEVIRGGANGRPGRPAKRYRVRDVDRVRQEIRALERDLEAAGAMTSPQLDANSDEDRVAAISSAEDAVLDSWSARTPDERAVLAQTALAALGAARRIMPEDVVAEDAALRRRANDVEVFARLADAEASGKPIGTERLYDAATALSDLAEVAPERVPQFILGLSATALRNDQSLPFALALRGHHEPIEAISAIDASSWVKTVALADTNYVLWSQRWAAPLAKHRLFTGTVVGDIDEGTLDAPLRHLSKWQSPTIVISERDSVDLVRRVSESGAFFLPVSAGMSGIARTMLHAYQRRASPAMGETASYDFGQLDRFP